MLTTALANRSKAFRLLKRTHNMQNLFQCIKVQAVERRMVRQAKRESWSNFCSKIGRTTPVEKVWGLVKRMGEGRREWD